LTAVVDSSSAVPKAEEIDWYSAPLGDLISHIVNVHHDYLKNALPWLRSLMPLAIKAHENTHGRILQDVLHLFTTLDAEISDHLFKEEQVLFPYIAALEKHVLKGKPKPQPLFGSAANPIHQMELEHEIAGAALSRLRETTHNYSLPADACPTFVAVYEELQRMESDLRQHIHLENNILFPRTIELEEQIKE